MSFNISQSSNKISRPVAQVSTKLVSLSGHIGVSQIGVPLSLAPDGMVASAPLPCLQDTSFQPVENNSTIIPPLLPGIINTFEDGGEIKDKTSFVVGPNPNVKCNLRLPDFYLMSGFADLGNLAGEKPLAYPMVSSSLSNSGASCAIYPYSNTSKVGISSGLRAVSCNFLPPPIQKASLIYDSETSTCGNPRPLGFDHGNLVDRGMTVMNTIQQANYGISLGPV